MGTEVDAIDVVVEELAEDDDVQAVADADDDDGGRWGPFGVRFEGDGDIPRRAAAGDSIGFC